MVSRDEDHGIPWSKPHLRHKETLRLDKSRLMQVYPEKEWNNYNSYQKRQQIMGSNGIQR